MGTKRRRSMRIQRKTLHDSSSDQELKKTEIDKLSKKYQGSNSSVITDISPSKSTVQTSASSSLYDFSDDFMESSFSGNIKKTIKPIKTKPQQSNKKKVQEGKKKVALIDSQKQHKKEKQKSANVKKTDIILKKAVVKRIKGSHQNASTPVTQNFKAVEIKSSIKKSQILSPIENSETPVGNGKQNKSVSFCFKSPEILPVRRRGNQPINSNTNVQILRACDRKGSKVGTPTFKRKKDVQDENIREARSAKKTKLAQDTTLPHLCNYLDNSSEVNSGQCDSGVFVSPIFTKIKAKEKYAPKLPLSKFEAKETSTPVLKADTNKQSGRKGSCFIFKPAHSSSVLMPSSATRVEISLSDYSSIAVEEESMFTQVEAAQPSTSSNEVVEVQPIPVFNLNSSSEDEVSTVNRSFKSYKRSHKKIHVGRYSISKVEAWADKMNSQFEEIDKYELSIEG